MPKATLKELINDRIKLQNAIDKVPSMADLLQPALDGINALINKRMMEGETCIATSPTSAQ